MAGFKWLKKFEISFTIGCSGFRIKTLCLYNKSRAMGDYQAWFCERLRVKLPLPARLCDRYQSNHLTINLKNL
jgi:hypothetical protein